MTTNLFNLTRVYRTIVNGKPQISDFPDEAPFGVSDLEVRSKHFTEIENFTFLAYILAHELAGPAKLISTLVNLQVPDAEFQSQIVQAQQEMVTDEQLGDTILDIGINWEHFVASTNTLLIPGNPLKITDVIMQEKIDSLDLITEALVREVNLRAMGRA